MKLIASLCAGFAGAVALTVTHQALHKYITDDAPRMDLMGEEALEKLSAKAHIDIEPEKVFGLTITGDIIGNALFYSLAGIGKSKHVLSRSISLGLAAGIGGICLPEKIGLNKAYSARTPATKALTIVIYLLGGIVTGLLLKRKN